MTCAIVLCAGLGKRLNCNTPKCYLSLKDKPVLFYPLKLMSDSPLIDRTVISCPAGWINKTEQIVSDSGFNDIEIIEGGKTRMESAFLALESLSSQTSITVIHDGARPVASQSLLSNVITNARKFQSCVPVLTPTDTVKCFSGNTIRETLDRSDLVLSQTPQAFNYQSLLDSYKHAMSIGFHATDDSSVWEQSGKTSHIIPGEVTNIKITYSHDMTTAEYLLS